MLAPFLALIIGTTSNSGLFGQSFQVVEPGQARTSQSHPATDPTITVLEDVVVEGRPLSDATSDFVDRISAPALNRGAATWREQVCIGVGNLRRNAAEQLIDRISEVAEVVGLSVGSPGCQPRVFILFTEDANTSARELVKARGRQFRIGISGADRGSRALTAFLQSDKPVRWWQSSAPVDQRTGIVVSRLPGAESFDTSAVIITRPAEAGAQGINDFGSRLRSPLSDDLAQVIIIVDSNRVIGVDFRQLSDYLALISLAQIDPELDVGPYNSILSLFTHTDTAPPGLTDWDQAFLEGLYGAEQTSYNPRARLSAVADSMARKVRVRLAVPSMASDTNVDTVNIRR